jgi:hypothetical protein
MNKTDFQELAGISSAEEKLRRERERYLTAHGWSHVVDVPTSLWLWVKFLGPTRYTAPTIETALAWQMRALDAGTDQDAAADALELGAALDARNPLAALVREALDLVPRMSDDDPIAPALAAWCTRARGLVRGAS